MDYNENVWNQSILEKYRIKNGISVLDIINLYLDRCREAKDIYDKEVKVYRPFEVRLCEIINNSMKEYFDGKVDISNISEKDSCFDLGNNIQKASLDLSRDFDEYNKFLVVDLENIWKKDNKNSNTFFPCVFIDKNFNVYVPNKVIDYNDYRTIKAIVSEKVCASLKMSILKNKEELVVLKNKSDKYKSLEYEDKINKRKEELLMSINEISIKLDNDITLRFSISDRNFLESKIKRENVNVEAYDINNKFLWSNNNGLNNESNNISKDYKKILNFVSDGSCTWKLKAPFGSSKQLISNKKVNDEINREREIDLALAKALREKREEENKLKELKNDNKYYLEMYKNTNKQLEELTGKVNYNRISGMTEDMMFKKNNEGVLCVKDKYKDKLDLFDLSLIKWDNVDVKGLDFTGCNVHIDPQTVDNKDLSNIRFVSKKEDGSDFIFSEFSEFSNVNLNGAVIKCKNNILNISDSIMNDNTIIEAKNIVKEKGKHVYKNKEEKISDNLSKKNSTADLVEDTMSDLFSVDNKKQELKIMDSYRNKSYLENNNKRSRQDALNSLAKDIVDGILTDEDIYALLKNKKEDSLNKKL